MIKAFADHHTGRLFESGISGRLPADVVRRATRKLECVDLAAGLNDLRLPPGNRLHALIGDRVGQHAICELRWSMSIPRTTNRTVRPTHPGEFLREDFMPDYGLSVAGLAQAIGVSRQTVNEVLRGRRALSASMALRLARLFGNSVDFWLNAQRAIDLWDAEQSVSEELKRITPLRVA